MTDLMKIVLALSLSGTVLAGALALVRRLLKNKLPQALFYYLWLLVLLRLIAGKTHKPVWRQPVALVTAAGVKFVVLYMLVVKVICGIASGALMGKKLGDIVVLAPPMLKMLPTMFAWPQLFTALIGGAVALLITPVLRKALHK